MTGMVAHDVMLRNTQNKVQKGWGLRAGENTEEARLLFLFLSLRNLSSRRRRVLSGMKTEWGEHVASQHALTCQSQSHLCIPRQAEYSLLIQASSHGFHFNQRINSPTQTPWSFPVSSFCSLFLRCKSLQGWGCPMSESTVPLGHDTVGLEMGIQVTWEHQNGF